MFLRSILIFLPLLAFEANAQKASTAQAAFLQDINTVAGMSSLGGSRLAGEAGSKNWIALKNSTWALLHQGKLREAIRDAAQVLYLGETNHNGYDYPMIVSSAYISKAYSYAGDHANATIWADRSLMFIGKGYHVQWRLHVVEIRADLHRIKALGLGQSGQYDEAVKELHKGLDGLPRFGVDLLKSELQISLASLHTKFAAYDKANQTLADPLKEANPFLRAAANRVAGDLALARKDPAAATAFYNKAMEASRERNDQFRIALIRVGLARAARMAGDTATASSEVLQALGVLETLRESFSSLEMRTALYGNLQSVFDEAVDFFESRGETEKAFAASEAGRARAMLDLQRKVEAEAAPAARPRSLVETQAQMASGQTMVAYHQLPNRFIVWVITRDAARSHSLPVAAAQLRKDVTQLRVAIEQQDKAVLALAQSLHQQLIAPLQLSTGVDLVFVPHKSLHLLPFQALHDGAAWLVEKHSVATAMSASMHETSSKPAGQIKLAALGNPDLGKVEWALPGSEAEVKAIQLQYADSSVFVRKEATKARLKAIAPGADVVHIAAHAVVDEIDPMYSTIKLAHIGPLGSDMEARELATLNLRQARLVTLSACSSGLGKVADGDEFMGFKRALVSAGAKSALVSLWPVEDESTQMLMTEFHLNWKTATKARAMQAAQIKVLSNPKYASPFYWAAFTLVGDPG